MVEGPGMLLVPGRVLMTVPSAWTFSMAISSLTATRAALLLAAFLVEEMPPVYVELVDSLLSDGEMVSLH